MTATTLKRDLVPLREVLRWAFDEGKLEAPVQVLSPKKRATGTRVLDTKRVDVSAEQVEALIAELPERTQLRRGRHGMSGGNPIRALVTLAWETGLRHGALFGLEGGRHFKRGKRELFVSADIDKARFERTLPLTERAYQALDSVAPEVGLVFPRFDYRKSLRTAARRAGIEDFAGLDLRDLRHAATSDAARMSGHLLGTSYMAGHVQQGTTSRYIHPRSEDARKVLHARFGSGENRGSGALNAKASEPVSATPASTRNGVRIGGELAIDTPCVKTGLEPLKTATNGDAQALEIKHVSGC